MSPLLLAAVVGGTAGFVGGLAAIYCAWALASRELNRIDRDIEEDRRP